MKHLCVNKYSFNIIGCMHTIATMYLSKCVFFADAMFYDETDTRA
jgi:hypothetical protein